MVAASGVLVSWAAAGVPMPTVSSAAAASPVSTRLPAATSAAMDLPLKRSHTAAMPSRLSTPMPANTHRGADASVATSAAAKAVMGIHQALFLVMSPMMMEPTTSTESTMLAPMGLLRSLAVVGRSAGAERGREVGEEALSRFAPGSGRRGGVSVFGVHLVEHVHAGLDAPLGVLAVLGGSRHGGEHGLLDGHSRGERRVEHVSSQQPGTAVAGGGVQDVLDDRLGAVVVQARTLGGGVELLKSAPMMVPRLFRIGSGGSRFLSSRTRGRLAPKS